MTPYQRNYILIALDTAPWMLAHLLKDLTDAEADRRPDPARFTIREIVAHLADWEPIWLERLRRTVAEDRPFLPGYDEGQFALDHGYAQSDIAEQLERFRRGRSELVAFLRTLELSDWDRVGMRDEIGPVSVEQFAALLLAHQGYHDRQILEWRGLA